MTPPTGPPRNGPTILNSSEADEVVEAVIKALREGAVERLNEVTQGRSADEVHRVHNRAWDKSRRAFGVLAYDWNRYFYIPQHSKR